MANFNQFLDEFNGIDGGQIEDDGNDVTGNNFVCNNEISNEAESVQLFRSTENLPPSLVSLCIARLCSWMNQITSNPANHSGRNGDPVDVTKSDRRSVSEIFQKRVKLLPEDVQNKIISQLSFTTLKCIYKEQIWTLDPLVIAASIKQEEDMLRYLNWKDSTNPLLTHMEQSLVIDVFGDKKIIKLLNTKHLAPNTEAMVQSYLDSCFNYRFSDREEFMNIFHEMSNNGCLQGLNWNNVLVVGGIVLGSLRHEIQTNPSPHWRYGQYGSSDIDIYIYGLSNEQAQTKVEEIYKTISGVWKDPIGIFKTANTITLVSSAGFRNVQIILSTYASPLEILMASDMNSCSIGFNGQTVLTIPRFIFGSIYGSNVLDSSTKFGSKLRWERLAKYYHRGYNIVSPLHLRVHGHGSFNSEEDLSAIHPSTRQMIELMCLNKIGLLRISFRQEKFGLDRESTFDKWPKRWTRGITIVHRCFLTSWNQTEYQRLVSYLAKPPAWVKGYYKRAQNLTLPDNTIREALRYAEDQRTNQQFKYGRDSTALHNFNPFKGRDIHKYIQEYCKFDSYNDSSLQCFHLNFFVDKQQKETNPYKEMNTSLATLRYTLHTVPLAIKHFDKFLSGEIRSVSSTFQDINRRNWKLSFEWGSTAVSFLFLTKEFDEEDKDSYNSATSRPTKFFVNFLLRLKSLRTVQMQDPKYESEVPKDITFDGSQVFTYNHPNNTWMTWIKNQYFRAVLNDASESYIDYSMNSTGIDVRPRYMDVHGTINWEVTMQLIEPQFNINNM